MSSKKSSFTSRCAFQLPCDGSWVAPQNHYSLVKDLPWGEQPVFLRTNRRQFKCEKCQKPFSEDFDFVKKRKKYTNRYARWITEQVIKSDLLSVALHNNLTESKVLTIG